MLKVKIIVLKVIILKICLTIGLAQIQPDSSRSKKNPLHIEGYIDTYFSYEFNEPESSKGSYYVSYNRHNEVNINLAYVSLKYTSENIKAVFTPGFGTYMNANYINERGTIKDIVEAYVSLRVFKKKNIWLDVGVIPSPYTNENIIALDQLCYSRTFGPEYTPYYFGGVKLSLPLSDKVTFYTYLINGWQEIRNVNKKLALGTQLEFKVHPNCVVNWNTYLGNEQSVIVPDYKMRYFSDAYLILQAGKRFTLTGCVYAGLQEKIISSNEIAAYGWYQGNFAVRYKLNKKNALSARMEYFSDYNNIIISEINGIPGFDTYGTTLGYNLAITDQVLFRLEGKYLFSSQKVFEKNNVFLSNNTIILTGINARF